MKAKKTQLEILNAIYDQDLECHIRSYLSNEWDSPIGKFFTRKGFIIWKHYQTSTRRMMTNLHGLTATTKTLKSAWLTGLRESNLTHSIFMTSGAVGIPIRFTGATHLTTFDMIEPDEHDGDYAEERHNSKCEERDIDQGILSELSEEEWKFPHT